MRKNKSVEKKGNCRASMWKAFKISIILKRLKVTVWSPRGGKGWCWGVTRGGAGVGGAKGGCILPIRRGSKVTETWALAERPSWRAISSDSKRNWESWRDRKVTECVLCAARWRSKGWGAGGEEQSEEEEKEEEWMEERRRNRRTRKRNSRKRRWNKLKRKRKRSERKDRRGCKEENRYQKNYRKGKAKTIFVRGGRGKGRRKRIRKKEHRNRNEENNERRPSIYYSHEEAKEEEEEEGGRGKKKGRKKVWGGKMKYWKL